MNTLLASLTMAICIPVECIALVEEGVLPTVSRDHFLLDDPHWDVLVVTAERVTVDTTVGGTRPRGLFSVNEVLRGAPKPSPIELVWQEPRRSSSAVPGREPHDWRKEPLEKGNKLIVFGSMCPRSGSSTMTVVDAFMFTPENRQTVVTNMAPAERAGRAQLAVFLLLLLIPIACFGVIGAAVARCRWFPRRTARLACVVLGALEWCLYAWYESGVSAYTNIRIDLLLVWPALCVTLGALVCCLVVTRRM
jgi:hypothetical protein